MYILLLGFSYNGERGSRTAFFFLGGGGGGGVEFSYNFGALSIFLNSI